MAIRTNKAIIETFEKMLYEMPFEKITVSSLAKRCEISPNTFYYHYEDIYDLLEKWFAIKREEWIDLHDWKKSLKTMADSCKANKKRFYHIYNSLSRNYLERMIFRYEKDVIAEYFDTMFKDKNVSEDKKNEITDFVLFGLTGAFLKFVWNDMKEDTDKFVDSIADLIDGYVTYAVNKL
mgnify:FL=1